MGNFGHKPDECLFIDVHGSVPIAPSLELCRINYYPHGPDSGMDEFMLHVFRAHDPFIERPGTCCFVVKNGEAGGVGAGSVPGNSR